MNNFDSLKKLISQMAGTEHYITVNSVFVRFMGELEGGVFLSQLIYWSDKGSRSDGWIYKKAHEWESELGIKRKSLERNTKELVKRSILETKVMKDSNGTPAKHYRIKQDILQSELLKFMSSDLYDSTNGNVLSDKSSITKTTNIDYNIDINVADKSATANKPKTKKRIYDEQDQELLLAKYLFGLMKLNNEFAKEPNFQNWANDIRLMHERDNIPYEQIKNAITWCQKDSFWKANILSAKKLREKFPTLYLAAKNKSSNWQQKNEQKKQERLNATDDYDLPF